MKKLLLYAVSAALGTPLCAQESKTVWQKDLQSSTQDFLTQVSITPDGQYLVSGSSINPGGFAVGEGAQNNGYDYRLLKLDQQGNKVWEKYFAGNRHDYLAATAATREGGFIIAGTSYSGQSGDKKEKSIGGSDIWLIKINEAGDEEWQRTLGTKRNEEAKSVAQTADLGYFAVGDIHSSKEGFGGKDAFVARLDKTGKVKAQIILGGTGQEEVETMISTNDGGVLLGIYSRAGKSLTNSASSSAPVPEGEAPMIRIAKKSENFGEGDYWVVKLDKDGLLQWEKSFGGKDDDRIRTLSLTDSGYLIGGESRSQPSGNKRTTLEEGTDLWLIAVDESGNEEWQKSYSFGNRDVLMSQNAVNDIKGHHTKGFLIGGYTQSEGRVEKNDETFWMLYLDRGGREVWRKYVEGKSKMKEERLVSAKLGRDGSFILGGTSTEELGQENWKIVKLGDKDLDDLIERNELLIYPNPVEDYCYVEIGFEFAGEAQIALNDMGGRRLQTLKSKNGITKINTAGLPQGVYIVSATTEKKSVNSKIIKK